MQFSMYNLQSLNSENKIVEDNLLIQDSIKSWMIWTTFDFFALDLGNVGFSMTSFRLCNHRLLRSFRFRFTHNGGDSKTPLHQPACICLRKRNLLITLRSVYRIFPRKEVIQPHLPVRLPCYDFTPVTNPALGRCSLTVSSRTSGVVDFHGVTGGVYKTRERIQRSVLICVY